ncbi:TldD/PmbA family protein [Lysinibacillus sp. OL1_EC]|uniref:TldD/PmbA family protein n=1 Tax=unclassified Lysinibacillus TaxID=2636778 RepID=UPI00103922D0|nr:MULTISPECIES: TldD/PmbA family protein [unclassified Lysinibacillus]MCM0623423.1 TldD/PmbA family protein [Lysinibacillus sp. OL1_EC]TBV89667.1 TldD/PmbA family protein [Lysinibacillus sp. OL1]
MSITQFQNKLLQEAALAGLTEAEVYYEQKTSFQCTLYEGELDSYETSEDGGLSLRGVYNGKMGYAYTEKVDEDSISFLIDYVKANADVLDEYEDLSIFEGSLEYAEHSFYNEELAAVSIPEKIEFLRAIEQKIRAYDPRIVTLDYCILQYYSTERTLANSKKLSLSHKENGLILYLSTVVKEGDELKTGDYLKTTRDFHALDVDTIAKRVAEEALANLGEQSIPSSKYPILLRHDAAASLLNTFMPIFSAENAQKNQSLLKGKMGQQVASKGVTLLNVPYHPDALSGGNFDGEGVATKHQAIITEGTLQTLLHNRKTAAKDGCETTGHAKRESYKDTLSIAPQNIYIAPGQDTQDTLISSLSEGVLVTNLSGLHSGTNSISGDFSVAAQGFHIQDGKLASPVRQMTIAGNFFSLLKNIEAISSDLYFLPSGHGSPSIIVKELAVTVE